MRIGVDVSKIPVQNHHDLYLGLKVGLIAKNQNFENVIGLRLMGSDEIFTIRT